MMSTMENTPKPPGLLSRKIVAQDSSSVTIEEIWDMSVPGCPYIKNPWNPPPIEVKEFYRRVEMTKDEYEAVKPPLVDGDVEDLTELSSAYCPQCSEPELEYGSCKNCGFTVKRLATHQ